MRERGAPQTSMTKGKPGWQVVRQLGRDGPPNRIAWPSHGTCSDRASHRARPSAIASGVRLSETSVAISSPAVRPSGERGPASSTTPVSMPPEPVTGFCILPRVRMISSTAALILSGFPSCASCSWRKEAASRFSRRTLTLTSSGQIAGRGSSRQAAWGSTRPASAPGAGRAVTRAHWPDRSGWPSGGSRRLGSRIGLRAAHPGPSLPCCAAAGAAGLRRARPVAAGLSATVAAQAYSVEFGPRLYGQHDLA